MTTTSGPMHNHLVDIVKTLTTNPLCPPPLQDGWWQRHVTQITGITIHHTLGYSPWATARYYVEKGGGRPSIPYHYWVCPCGSVLRCLALTEGCWHDHTGHKNTNVSIGMAGSLHLNRPTEPQLASAAELVVYLLRTLGIPTHQIKGHNDRSQSVGYPTACPGWYFKRSGYWRTDFDGKIAALLTHPNGGTP